jgi:sulfite reductase (NADPH) hemoprotein beta-component
MSKSIMIGMNQVHPESGRTQVAVEALKRAVPTLAGRIATDLLDPATDRFAEDDTHFLKFHGIYQEDDRDLRKTGKKYIFMVRTRLPGGVIEPGVYLELDRLADAYGNGTLRITSRQGFQFHGVVKSGLGPLMRGLHSAMVTTLAACGDVNRNVLAPAAPAVDELGLAVRADARAVSDALLPRTKAYHSIWVEGVQLDLEAEENREYEDPLYGKQYLPRKFKVAFAIPPVNDVDVLTNCLGFVAIVEGGRLAGYNLTAGGGLGMSHGNAETYPRLADVVGFVGREQVLEAAKAVLTVYRDFGDRTNRKHARLKYVLAERGVDWFRGEVERRGGFVFGPARPFEFDRQGDRFGWHAQEDGRWFLGLFVEGGRVADRGDRRLRTGLREVVDRYRPELRLTASQNLVLANVVAGDRAAVTAVLERYGVPVERQASAVRSSGMACVSMPTCGLALAEAERALPGVMTQFESVLEGLGLADEEITVRMTGCPNGCVRPYVAEVGLVGRAPGRYQVLLGGNVSGTRLNRVYRDNVKEGELAAELAVVFGRFAKERVGGERFGDWVARKVWA